MLNPGEFLRCGRCGEELKTSAGTRSIEKAWAFSTAGLIFLVLANVYPVMSFDVAGNSQDNLIFTGVEGLWSQGYKGIAALVFLSAIAAPALHLATVWYVSAACCLNFRWPARLGALNLALKLEPWNLLPVFAIACVVSVVKLDTIGDVTWTLGSLWVALVALCSLFTMQFFDRRILLVHLEENP